jgi:conjugative relaxase-like TrwC/TraI family protein
MTATVTAASGYDLGYVWKNQAQGKDAEREQGKGGYYINAAQHGEAAGRWSGRGAEALGFATGQEVEREPYDKVYRQVHPQDGSKLGRAPGTYRQKHDILLALKEAEPHATSERMAELERIAAAAARKSPAYTDVTVSLVKSVSIFHASVRENERLARLAGDDARAAWWAAREAEVQEALQNANRVAMQHLQDWAVTRTGHHGARVDGQEPGRYEPAGLVVTSWLQGTSRDGDPQDHIHNQIARMSLTGRDGKWRAVDTMAVRAQLGAVRATFGAHLRAEMTQRFGVEWVPRKDGDGQEIKGITRAQIDAYSTRTQRIGGKTRDLVAAWTREHGEEPNRRQLLYLQQAATMASRENKPEGDIDWDEYLREWAGKWEADDGSSLAAVAGKVSSLRGPDGAPREPAQPGFAPSADALLRVMQAAVARVQEHEPTWTRADLMREIADSMPPETAQMTPGDAVALVHELTGRALAGEVGQVMSLEAPDHLDTPEYLRRGLDGKSMYSRPGVERFTTRVQIAREKELLASMEKDGAPHLTREQSARLLGAEPDELEAAARAKVNEPTPQLPSGVTVAQGAAIHSSLTSDRTGYAIVGPAGTGKTRVAATQARTWTEAGKGDVILLAPSQAAADVLRQETGGRYPVYNTAQFLGHLEEQRGALGPVAIKPGTLLLADESSMTPIADLRDIARYAADMQSAFRALGDDGQLTAPEGGGGLSLITRSQEHVQLAEPKRFAAGWEAGASLRVRAGDTSILDEYEQQGRIRGGGTLDEVMDQASRQFLAGYLQGKDVLLMAQSNEHAREMSARIRDELQHLGLVGRGPEASLREGAKASAGDLIVTRQNDHRLGITNGDAWRVEHVDGETVTMRKMLDADRETGERRFAEETVVYKAAKEGADLAYAENPAREDEQREATRPADLGYSITGHTGQGRTVWQGNALFTGTENRNWAYPALTRGTHANYAWVVGQPPKVADPAQGTRTAPELERQERIERERAGLLAESRKLTQQEQELARDPKDVLADVLERDGTVYSALETRQRNLSNADHLGNLHAIWQGETREPVNARYEGELRGQLPDGFRDAKLSGHATWLYRTLREAEAAGLDSKGVLARAINSQPLTGARDVAAVVDARVRAQTSGLVPQQPRPWAERVPEDDHQERREYLTRVGKAMDDRTQRLGQHTAEAKPAWAERAFGPVSDDAEERQAWEDRASAVASYREMFGWGDPEEPIGPEPVNSPEARQQWHAAFAALGPVDGQDLRALSDGQLLLRRDGYERETAWAPQWVGDQLRQVRAGADDAERDAVLSSARAEAARKREEHELAGLHDSLARSQRAMAERYRGFEAQFARTMEARKEWEATTRQQRHDALTAHTEYVRRHPDTDLPPLKSAEPERPTEEEQAKLHVPEIGEYEPPAWLAGMAERTTAANEEIADRLSMKMPDEDHEWGGQQAWPASMTLNRDAILQPPAPQIPPAAEVAEQAAQMDREAGE